jgi:fructoselysine-6-P-deglycase FrlB-like protein
MRARRAALPASLPPDGPDLMGREIARGPDAVRATLAEVAAGAAPLGRALGRARRIVLVGTGASLAAARTVAPVWRAKEIAAGSAIPVLVREAAEIALDGPGTPDGESGPERGPAARPRPGGSRGRTALDGQAFVPGDLVVAISRSGTSPETLAAVQLALRAGCATIAITATAASPLAVAAGVVLLTPCGPEEGAATKSEVAALAALLGLAGLMSADAASGSRLRDLLTAAVEDWPPTARLGATLAAAGRLWFLGFGPGAGCAAAAALLWNEKARRPASAMTPSEFRHGAVEAARRGDAVVVIAPEDTRGDARYLGLLAAELGQLGVRSVWVMAEPPEGLVLAEVDCVWLRGAAVPVRCLEALVRLQQLARAGAHAAGTYRDGFRTLRRVVRPAGAEDLARPD